MFENKEKTLVFDPRAEIIFLILANIAAFTQRSIYVEVGLIALLIIMLVYAKCYKASVKWIILFGITLMLQYYILPYGPKFIRDTFSFLVYYVRKIFPCLIVGTLIVKTTEVRYFVLALRKWHLPEQIIIPLSVTMRYFPSIKEETGHIRDAMKLRKVKGVAKFECYLVPLMISATNTAEELSAAAVTRGIENPVRKTSVVNIHFHIQDYICLALIIISVIGAAVFK
ncbi:energy-coupling factor transporter transmembrane component T [Vallitalea guaymasensis]|uniref:energy-coupling factor transporter transmembrane component T n=1 Tax=Vallitalea guaymasensis TaxID=1185412 RepID=UPI00272A5E0B|nr:energy-coupling factor transporter transmembrane component T [Vallitalea guaymasensis]